jgi:polar amino acid transport system substrate-binding protein
MRLCNIRVIIFLLGAIVFSSASAANAPVNNSAPSLTNHGDLVSFVDKAVAYAKTNGKEKAIAEINNSKGEFVNGSLYVFAVDFNSVALAHPKRPDFIGKNQLGLQDTNGAAFFKNMLAVAKYGDGYVYYIFANPANKGRQELKLTYVEKVDDSWWVGAGTYLSDIPANFSEASRNNLTSFVESAAKYAKDNGKDNALKVFNDKNGTFFKNGLYVFAYDFAGNTLAAPTQPTLIGTNRIDAPDPNGVKFIRDMADLAKGGSGFTYYIYADPKNNMTQRLKLSYVMKVDDNWWVGAGLYAQ